MATCTIQPGLLVSGDRVEIRFDLEHEGVTAGYSFDVRWGATATLTRDASPSDTFVTGRIDANLSAGSTRFGTLSWGSTLPLTSTVASAPDPYSSGLSIDFRGRVGQPGETLALRNYTVIRFP
jgi:hypothetical protein